MLVLSLVCGWSLAGVCSAEKLHDLPFACEATHEPIATRSAAAGSPNSLLVACPSWAQKTGSTGSSGRRDRQVVVLFVLVNLEVRSPRGQPGSVTHPESSVPNSHLYKRTSAYGYRPPGCPAPVSVGLYCGMGECQAIDTESKVFPIHIGAVPQSNRDLTASDSSMGGMGGMNSPGGFGSAGGFGGMGSGGGLLGCELRVSVSGYQPIVKSITDPGRIADRCRHAIARRIDGVQGSSISVTSLQVPNNARKEFEKGDRGSSQQSPGVGNAALGKGRRGIRQIRGCLDRARRSLCKWPRDGSLKQAYGKAISSDCNRFLRIWVSNGGTADRGV